MYTDYCHWLSINLMIHSSYKMAPDLPSPGHVFELFPMHATWQESFRGHSEACSSKAGVFNFHCSCLRALLFKRPKCKPDENSCSVGSRYTRGLIMLLFCFSKGSKEPCSVAFLTFLLKQISGTLWVFLERRISKWRGTIG